MRWLTAGQVQSQSMSVSGGGESGSESAEKMMYHKPLMLWSSGAHISYEYTSPIGGLSTSLISALFQSVST